MAAYLIVHRRDITDPERLKEYSKGINATIEKFGGKVVIRSDRFEVLEGDWHPGRKGDDAQPERITVIEFPDMDALRSWYGSEDYGRLKHIRQASAVCDVVAAEGKDL